MQGIEARACYSPGSGQFCHHGCSGSNLEEPSSSGAGAAAYLEGPKSRGSTKDRHLNCHHRGDHGSTLCGPWAWAQLCRECEQECDAGFDDLLAPLWEVHREGPPVPQSRSVPNRSVWDVQERTTEFAARLEIGGAATVRHSS